MNGLCRVFAVLLAIVVAASAARAAPPTVTPSPGYDARLQEQRNATSTSTVVEPAAPPQAVRKHHGKRTKSH